MNDVLPKPFTKEGLLSMLEKHLGHLKKPADGLEPTQQAAIAPTAHHSGRQSVKDEDSPGKSPATISTNWNSPSQRHGASPVGSTLSDEYMSAVRVHSATYGMDSAINQHGNMHFSPAPPTPIASQRGQQHGSHRRNVSDISGGEEAGNDPKRLQMFAPPIVPQR